MHLLNITEEAEELQNKITVVAFNITKATESRRYLPIRPRATQEFTIPDHPTTRSDVKRSSTAQIEGRHKSAGRLACRFLNRMFAVRVSARVRRYLHKTTE